ncbi:MAG: serine/threonine-protein kinase [Acidobacteria bacterium]|nr:serine/threonine-protein kinase [Acidobacteriota bacterium]
MQSSSVQSLEVGKFFHGLLVHSLLGQGAMGAAYLASHPILQIPLVIKTFNVSNDLSIFKEAHLAARVSSPNVVSVLDAGIETGIPFVIQRYIDGIDLSELLGYLKESNWRLPINIVCRIVIDVARGLHSIHQAGVIHRDVKPANLFLCGDGVTAVGDFGVAVDLTKGQDPNENVDSLAGTPSFMAPEQWLQERLERQTDVYALGITAHVLATNQVPFKGRNWYDLHLAHTSSLYQAPKAETPAEAYLFAVIEKALNKKASDRFSSTEAMAQVLERIIEPIPKFILISQDIVQVGAITIELKQGDLAQEAGEVIVNAANTNLTMRLGVANALRLAGGDSIEQEAMAQGPVKMGDVVWTNPGKLRTRILAHAVAALDGAICLQRTTLRVLMGAETRNFTYVLFPALGTGVGDVPMDLAAKLMLEAIQSFASLQPRNVRRIKVVLFSDLAISRWRHVLNSM